jgi:hypothetical protein
MRKTPAAEAFSESRPDPVTGRNRERELAGNSERRIDREGLISAHCHTAQVHLIRSYHAPLGFAVPHSAIAVFTANSRAEILEVGGSVSWVVAEKQARRREFLVCIRNARDVDFHDHEPHGTAFLIGRISGLKPFGYDKKGMQRWIIEISDYALVDYPEKWGEWRNPVKYTTLEELGIDPKKLKFKPMPMPTKVLTPPAAPDRPKTGALTIVEAKAGLALQFGVPPEAIEILIKG